MAPRQKDYDTTIICFLEFFVTMISNTGSSIAPGSMEQLGVSREVALFCFMTLYLVGQALGGLVFSPLAERFGGRDIYLISTFGYALFCLMIAIWPVLPLIIVGRLLKGILYAIPAVVAVGTFENMWDCETLSMIVHLWQAGAVVGLCAGPPFAVTISSSGLGWSWVFALAAAVMGTTTVFCLGMQKSRPSQVLRQKVQSISRELAFDGLSLEGESCLLTVAAFVRTLLVLPVRLFFTEPVVFATSIMAATATALVYPLSEALPIVYEQGFGFNDRRASLTMLAIAAGVIFAFLPRLHDLKVITLRKQ